MIQDIAPKKFYNQFAAKKPSANSRILSFSDGKILYKEKDGEMEFLTFKQVEAHFIQEKEKSELPVYMYSQQRQAGIYMYGIAIISFVADVPKSLCMMNTSG